MLSKILKFIIFRILKGGGFWNPVKGGFQKENTWIGINWPVTDWLNFLNIFKKNLLTPKTPKSLFLFYSAAGDEV